MKIEEAIKDIKENIQPSVGGKSLEMAIEALEKQIPMKPNKYEDIEGITDFYCDKCSRVVGEKSYKFLYCPKCGQAIDWKVEE